MKLSVIIGDKGGDVVTIEAGASLYETARLLRHHKIGSVVVMGDDRIVGVISERDIVARVADMGASAISLKVEDAMTKDVITVGEDIDVESGLALMTKHRIRHLPIVKDDKLLGIVSIGDLVKHKIAVTEAEAEAMKQYIHAG